MHAADGIGLAAPQVGNNIRVCTIGKDAIPRNHIIWDQIGKKHVDIALINPTWERTSKKADVDTEGCLSVPGKIGRVKRYKDIRVTAWDRDGKELHFDAHNYFSRVIQHEVDHLNGILFIDKATEIQDTDFSDDAYDI
jgi:peptide deformylase